MNSLRMRLRGYTKSGRRWESGRYGDCKNSCTINCFDAGRRIWLAMTRGGEDGNTSNLSSGNSGNQKDNNCASNDTQQQQKNRDPPGRDASTMRKGVMSGVLTLATNRQSS